MTGMNLLNTARAALHKAAVWMAVVRYGSSYDLDDAVGVARTALVEAAAKYQPREGQGLPYFIHYVLSSVAGELDNFGKSQKAEAQGAVTTSDLGIDDWDFLDVVEERPAVWMRGGAYQTTGELLDSLSVNDAALGVFSDRFDIPQDKVTWEVEQALWELQYNMECPGAPLVQEDLVPDGLELAETRGNVTVMRTSEDVRAASGKVRWETTGFDEWYTEDERGAEHRPVNEMSNDTDTWVEKYLERNDPLVLWFDTEGGEITASGWYLTYDGMEALAGELMKMDVWDADTAERHLVQVMEYRAGAAFRFFGISAEPYWVANAARESFNIESGYGVIPELPSAEALEKAAKVEINRLMEKSWPSQKAAVTALMQGGTVKEAQEAAQAVFRA